MNNDLRTLSVHQLIAHDIPKRRKSDEVGEIPLSESIPNLPARTLGFFCSRLQGTLQKKGQPVEVDPALVSPTMPPVIDNWLGEDEVDLVETSQSAAKHLYSVQGGSASVGLLAVAQAQVAGKPALAIMKLPHEEGLRIEEVVVNGKTTLSISVLGDLTLTEHTRVFKAGLFWKEDDKTVGLVSDAQTGESSEIAGFFLSEFLGFMRQRLARVITKTFKRAIEEFISHEVHEEELKLNYFNALHVELNSNAPEIDPNDFVNRHFHDAHKQSAMQALGQHGIGQAAFPKDLSLLPKEGRKGRLRTQGGLTISGDTEALSQIETLDLEGRQAIVIYDSLDEVS